MSAQYVSGAELADLEVIWSDSDGAVIDFSAGYTFSLKVGVVGQAASFTKTTNITGASTAPNLTVAWATSGELNGLSAGGYTLQITATRAADSKTRILQGRLDVLAAVL